MSNTLVLNYLIRSTDTQVHVIHKSGIELKLNEISLSMSLSGASYVSTSKNDKAAPGGYLNTLVAVALVYVPYGSNAQKLQLDTPDQAKTSFEVPLYQPKGNLIWSTVTRLNGFTDRLEINEKIRVPVTLHEGDSLVLLACGSDNFGEWRKSTINTEFGHISGLLTY